VQLVKGDIQSMDLLSFVLQTEAIDTIMHFAAQVRVARRGSRGQRPHHQPPCRSGCRARSWACRQRVSC
jgi:hypothetical protein